MQPIERDAIPARAARRARCGDAAALARQGRVRLEGGRRPGDGPRHRGPARGHARSWSTRRRRRGRARSTRSSHDHPPAHAGAARATRRDPSTRPIRSSVPASAVIVSAVRTPTGKFLGSLKGFTRAATRRARRRRGGPPRRHRSRASSTNASWATSSARASARTRRGRRRSHGGLSNRRRRAHHQQGLRLGLEGRDARGAGHRRPATSRSRSPAAWSR